jgi:hypothetical protein
MNQMGRNCRTDFLFCSRPPAEIENLIAKLRNERDPAFEFFKIFGRRGVKLAHLLETFKQMNFEFYENGGLKLVKKQSSRETIPLTSESFI